MKRVKHWADYRVRIVDASLEDTAEEIRELHRLTFEKGIAVPSLDEPSAWWLAYLKDVPVAFAGIQPSFRYENSGYLCRSGVHPDHRGYGLQLRLLYAREAYARRQGWVGVVTDTTDNVHSSNNMIEAGYLIFEPETKWAFDHSIYWRKAL